MKKKTIAVRFAEISRQLKKLFALWLCIAILLAIVVNVVKTLVNHGDLTMSSSITFSYDGIEKGVDPLGNKFSCYDMKTEELISQAAEQIGKTLTEDEITLISQNLVVSGTIPEDAISKITDYVTLLNDGNVATEENITDTSYNPSQYALSLKYRKVGFSRGEAVDFVNALSQCYVDDFLKKYGYNTEFENSILNVSYKDYDYAESIDVIESYLDQLQDYINALDADDNTRFRSDETGHSFSDISEAINTFKTENLDWILSYIITNNVTKNDTTLKDYYEYKIRDYKRSETAYKEQLTTVKSLISEYEKTNTVVLGMSEDSTSQYTYSQTSEEYDNLIQKKLSLQSSVSRTEKYIDLYTSRISKINAATNRKGDPQVVEDYLDGVYEKIKTLLDDVNKTTNEYYAEEKLDGVVKVTEEAGYFSGVGTMIKHGVKNCIGFEFILFGIYFLTAYILVETGKELKIFKFSSSKNKDKKNKKEVKA